MTPIEKLEQLFGAGHQFELHTYAGNKVKWRAGLDKFDGYADSIGGAVAKIAYYCETHPDETKGIAPTNIPL